MKLNSSIKIIGRNVILVPYRHYHVPKYHEWMKSEELQKLTASEPLTLEEEYEMQKTWREDNDKCTFIVLDKVKYATNQDEVESMIGDTNIFITDPETETGEIEIMVADVASRGKRLGWETVTLMLLYGIKYLNLKQYEAKISLSNNISIKMFEKLGFLKRSVSEAFQEITLAKEVDNEWEKCLEEQNYFEIQSHE